MTDHDLFRNDQVERALILCADVSFGSLDQIIPSSLWSIAHSQLDSVMIDLANEVNRRGWIIHHDSGHRW